MKWVILDERVHMFQTLKLEEERKSIEPRLKAQGLHNLITGPKI